MTGAAGSPTASRLIFSAASRYRSMVAGETNSRSAILSKPLLALSGGSRSEIHLFRQGIQREQIADRVFVFGAAEAVQQREFSGIRLRGGGAVEFGFKIGCHAAVRRFVRPR